LVLGFLVDGDVFNEVIGRSNESISWLKVLLESRLGQ